MTLNEFKNSANGSRLAQLFSDATLIERMEAMSRRGSPAVKAIDAEVALAVGTLDTVEKQHVGRWVRDILGSRGFTVDCQRDWRGGKVFSSGSVYRPIARTDIPAVRHEPPRNTLDSARAALSAGRRDPACPLDTVDGFIADRRANWHKA